MAGSCRDCAACKAFTLAQEKKPSQDVPGSEQQSGLTGEEEAAAVAEWMARKDVRLKRRRAVAAPPSRSEAEARPPDTGTPVCDDTQATLSAGAAFLRGLSCVDGAWHLGAENREGLRYWAGKLQALSDGWLLEASAAAERAHRAELARDAAEAELQQEREHRQGVEAERNAARDELAEADRMLGLAQEDLARCQRERDSYKAAALSRQVQDGRPCCPDAGDWRCHGQAPGMCGCYACGRAERRNLRAQLKSLNLTLVRNPHHGAFLRRQLCRLVLTLRGQARRAR